MSALVAPVREMPQATETLTAHAWLIPLGLFAERIGLIAGFETVPIGHM